MQSLVTIRMDENLKSRFDLVCNELGMTMSTAITVFAKQVCREGKIPFEITLGQNYKEILNMTRQIKYEVGIYPNLAEEKVVKESFENLNDAIRYLYSQEAKISNEWFNSDDERLQKSFMCLYVNILSLDEHSHIIVHDDDGLAYIKDGVREKIEHDDELSDDPGYIHGIIQGRINALINQNN